MKAYKGFNKDMTCRDFQFEEGKTYEEKKAVLCNSGFHACENPLDCLSYYSPNKSVYHEVDLDGVSDERERQEDSKVCGKRITIGARLDFAGMVKGAVSFVFEKVKATTGNWAHAATTGNEAHAATTGDMAHAATSGNEAHAATTGNEAHAATTGDMAHAEVKGKNSIAAALGYCSSAKAALGCWIVCAEYDDTGKLKEVKVAKVDGESIKTDTWYQLEDGNFVEVK